MALQDSPARQMQLAGNLPGYLACMCLMAYLHVSQIMVEHAHACTRWLLLVTLRCKQHMLQTFQVSCPGGYMNKGEPH